MENRVQLHEGGRLIVPANLRKALKIQPGDELILQLENGSLRLIPLQQAVRLAQKAVRKYVPSGTSLVDDLIEARKEEAARE